MYAICKTSGKDVLVHIKQMIEKGDCGSRVIQTTDKLHAKLDKIKHTAAQPVWDLIDRRKNNSKIDLDTKTLHKTDCPKCGMNCVNASILRPSKTGLKLCGCKK
jgi:hypothetical protein